MPVAWKRATGITLKNMESRFTLTFPSRQTAIRRSSWFKIGTIYGQVLCEFVPNSEQKKGDGSWSYSFFVQPEDVPSALNICEITSAQLASPVLTPLLPQVIESTGSIEVTGAGTELSPIHFEVKISTDSGNKTEIGTDGAVFSS